MNKLLDLPDDVFKHHLMQYVAIVDVVSFDSACMNHKYRNAWLDKVKGGILIGDMVIELTWDVIQWFHMKGIYLQHMNLELEHIHRHDMTSSTIELNPNHDERRRSIASSSPTER